MMYNAFISYSHAADGKLAPALQSGLEKFAKPWYKIRNLNVFRDEASLTASPHLWTNIQKALSESEYLIYMASPTSANSKWVIKEIEYWVEKKQIDNLLVVLTDGEIVWDDKNSCFLNPLENSLPDILDKKFIEEPFYVDLRHLRTEKDLSLNNPIFKKEILKLASQIHGKEPKDLASEEVVAHRKMMRVRNFAIGFLILLLVAAIGAAWIANKNAIVAKEESFKSRMASLTANGSAQKFVNPTVGIQLAAVSFSLYPNNNSAEALHDILSDTNVCFYSKRFPVPAVPEATYAINDSLNSIVEPFSDNIKIVDITTGKTRYSFVQDVSSKIAVWDMDRNGSTIIFCDSSGKAYLANPFTGRRKQINSFSSIPQRIIFSETRDFYIASFEGAYFLVIDTLGKVKDTLYKRDYIRGAAISDDGVHFAYSLEDSVIGYNLLKKKRELDWYEPRTYDDLSFSHDNKLIVTSSHGIEIWEVANNTRKNQRRIFDRYFLNKVKLLSGAKGFMCLAGDQKSILLVDTSGKLIRSFMTGVRNLIDGFQISDKEQRIITYCRKDALLWELKQADFTVKMEQFSGAFLAMSEGNTSIITEYSNSDPNTPGRILIKRVNTDSKKVDVIDTIQSNYNITDMWLTLDLQKLVFRYGDSLIVKNLTTKARFSYHPGADWINSDLSISPASDKFIFIAGDSLVICGINEKKVIKYKPSENYAAAACPWGSKILVAEKHQVLIMDDKGVVKDTLIDDFPFSIVRIYSVNNYVFLISQEISARSPYMITVLNNKGYRLKTYYVPTFFSPIIMSKDENKFTILTREGKIEERIMPFTILKSICPLSDNEEIFYGVDP